MQVVPLSAVQRPSSGSGNGEPLIHLDFQSFVGSKNYQDYSPALKQNDVSSTTDGELSTKFDKATALTLRVLGSAAETSAGNPNGLSDNNRFEVEALKLLGFILLKGNQLVASTNAGLPTNNKAELTYKVDLEEEFDTETEDVASLHLNLVHLAMVDIQSLPNNSSPEIALVMVAKSFDATGHLSKTNYMFNAQVETPSLINGDTSREFDISPLLIVGDVASFPNIGSSDPNILPLQSMPNAKEFVTPDMNIDSALANLYFNEHGNEESTQTFQLLETSSIKFTNGEVGLYEIQNQSTNMNLDALVSVNRTNANAKIPDNNLGLHELDESSLIYEVENHLSDSHELAQPLSDVEGLDSTTALEEEQLPQEVRLLADRAEDIVDQAVRVELNNITAPDTTYEPNKDIVTGVISSQVVSSIAKKLDDGIKPETTERLSISLNPQSLGNLEIVLEKNDSGTLFALLHFEKNETLVWFQSHREELMDTLRSIGFEGDNISMSLSSGSDQQEGKHSSNAYMSLEDQEIVRATYLKEGDATFVVPVKNGMQGYSSKMPKHHLNIKA